MRAPGAHRIVDLGADEVDRVESLWRGMMAHHDAVIGDVWAVREAGDAWAKRRAQYVEWLGGGRAWMLAALPPDDGEPLGYAVLTVHPPGPTFDLGEEVGDLESLSVSPGARGAGVGTALIEACRRILRDRGVNHWSVTAVDSNEGALRLYAREGFLPIARVLMAPVEPGPLR